MSEKTPVSNSLSYRDAGVDIDAGDALVRDIAPDAKRTRRAGADGALGGFGGLFDIKAAGFSDPVLVAATDGVGTKLELARAVGSYRGLGIDLVAMCVNDIIAQGATPLFFLDYFATGRLDRALAGEVIAGIADGCVECEAALIGGETAEMPGVYPDGGFDLAGFSVGAAERGTLLSRDMPSAGDTGDRAAVFRRSRQRVFARQENHRGFEDGPRRYRRRHGRTAWRHADAADQDLPQGRADSPHGWRRYWGSAM